MRMQIASAVVLLGLTAFSGSNPDIDLAGATVVVPDAPQKWERLAADDLSAALTRASGKASGVRGESEAGADATGARVYVGRTRFAAQAGVDVARLEAQEFRVRTLPGAVIVAGGRPTGTSYGVSDLLATRFGIYELDAGVNVVPADPHLRLPTGLDYTRKPAIRFRDIYRRYDLYDEVTDAARNDLAQFRRRNYFAWDEADLPPDCRPTRRMLSCHTFQQLIPPETFAKTHPEWFSLTKSGKRTFEKFGGQLCLTNPEMRREATRKLLEIIAEDRKGTSAVRPGLYEVSQCDFSPDYLCACANCQTRVRELGGENGLLLDFVNELAGRVSERYPDVSIRTFAYECTERPSKVTPAPNVIVRYCDFYSKHVDLYPLEAPENAGQLALYREWVDRKCRLELWDYLLYNFASGQMKFETGLPATSVDAIIGDARLFARTGLERIFVEAEYGKRYPKSFRKLEYFLLGQLLFDPKKDAEGLVDTFLRGYYGPAADEMAACLKLLREAQRTHRTSPEAWKSNDFAHLTPDFVSSAEALLSAAYAKAGGDAVLAARVADDYVNVLRAKMRLTNGRRGQEDAFARAEDLCRRLDEVRVRAPTVLTKTRHDAFAAALKAEHDVYGARNYGELPPEVQGVSAANLMGVPSPCLALYGHGRLEKDPDSAMPKSLFWQPPADARFQHGLPTEVGAFSGREKGMSCSLRIREVPADGRYHWYRIGTLPLSRQSCVYISPDWQQRIVLSDFCLPGTPDEGVNNTVEVWLSLKFRGPAYVKGSTDPNEVAADRVLLVRDLSRLGR